MNLLVPYQLYKIKLYYRNKCLIVYFSVVVIINKNIMEWRTGQTNAG